MPSPPYKVSSKSTSRLKSSTHLRCLNVCNFGMVEATELNSMESRSSSMPLPPYKVSCKSTNWFKFIKVFVCTHFRSLNVRHFGVAEAMGLKMCPRGHLQWHHLPTKFHENPLIGSKLTSGHTHIHTAW
jgi:hypothetical protein